MKKSLLFFVVLVVLYEVFIRSVDVWWTLGQNQWHANRIVANNFVFRTREYANVMVGSSMAARLTNKISKDSLPADFYNLSLNGQSLFDGLLILKESGCAPKNLFIETNVLMRNEDPELHSAIFSPLTMNLKKYIKSWRDNYQPIELLYRIRSKKPTNADLLSQVEAPRDEKSYKTMLAVQLEKNNVPLEEKALKKQVEKLKELVLYFQKKGSHVVLFELPVDSSLCYAKQVTQSRGAIKEAFVPMKCDFIQVPSCNEYRTTDGTHLDVPSVYTYLHYFRNAIGSFAEPR